MKKLMCLVLLVVLAMSAGLCYGNDLLPDEEQYGKKINFQTSSDYPGDVSIDGLYVHQNKELYIFTILYSGGILATEDQNGKQVVDTSFFNPPSGTIISINNGVNNEFISSKPGVVQYTVKKEWIEAVKADKSEDNVITVFLHDIEHNSYETNIMVFFNLNELDTKLPLSDEMKLGYEIENNQLDIIMSAEPSSWAKKNIEELKCENIFRDDAFSDFQNGITRKQFVYLMVEMYETLADKSIDLDFSIHFEDSQEIYVMKAASLGITSGVGENMFGPDLILDREQMTTMLIKTLQLAGIELNNDEDYEIFSDDELISEWAKTAIYLAKENDILGGVGDNKFEAKDLATNEQVLTLTHKILTKYGSIKWFEEYEGDRFYLKHNDALYQVNLKDNMLIYRNDEDTEIFFKTFDDINTFVNLLLLENRKLSFLPSSNPNTKGVLEEYDYKKLNMKVNILYKGVDKIGEETIVTLDKTDYKSRVVDKWNIGSTALEGFEKVKYYDLDGEKQMLNTLPLGNLGNALDIKFSVEYDEKWNIVILEVLDEDE